MLFRLLIESLKEHVTAIVVGIIIAVAGGWILMRIQNSAPVIVPNVVGLPLRIALETLADNHLQCSYFPIPGPEKDKVTEQSPPPGVKENRGAQINSEFEMGQTLESRAISPAQSSKRIVIPAENPISVKIIEEIKFNSAQPASYTEILSSDIVMDNNIVAHSGAPVTIDVYNSKDIDTNADVFKISIRNITIEDQQVIYPVTKYMVFKSGGYFWNAGAILAGIAVFAIFLFLVSSLGPILDLLDIVDVVGVIGCFPMAGTLILLGMSFFTLVMVTSGINDASKVKNIKTGSILVFELAQPVIASVIK